MSKSNAVSFYEEIEDETTLSSDISDNIGNLNDFMARNTLIGSNLYISPMNSTGIDDINRKRKNGNSKIDSSFYPIVKLS